MALYHKPRSSATLAKKSWGGHPGTRNDFADGRSSQSSPPNDSSDCSLAKIPPSRAATLLVLLRGSSSDRRSIVATPRKSHALRGHAHNASAYCRPIGTRRTRRSAFVTPPTGRRTHRLNAGESQRASGSCASKESRSINFAAPNHRPFCEVGVVCQATF